MKSGRSDCVRVSDLTAQDFSSRLQQGVGLQIGPFRAHIAAVVPGLDELLYRLYRDYPLVSGESVFSFHARIEERREFPGIGKPLVRFSVDGRAPHEDLPAYQALPVLEWGINLVIALRSHAFLMLHSGVVEYGGNAMLLPAAPGAGKTTLCAGLALRDWRLLSDEFGLVRPGSTEFLPIPRPLALKNESIGIVRKFSSNVWLGPEIPETRKGTVAHLRPPNDSLLDSDRGANVRWLVFPEYQAGAPTTLDPVRKHEAFMMLATNAFNYELLGESAYATVSGIVDRADCYRFVYSNLDDAVNELTLFAESSRAI
jgi:HprK-related kinase A